MRIGIPRETKDGEVRVALVPRDAAALASDGQEIVVESGAGAAIGHDDAAYRAAGAGVAGVAHAWDCDLVVKVKEIQDQEFARLRPGQAIFSFHHLPGEPGRTRRLAASGVTAIAFEMVRDARGGFPLLAPMSAIAGRMAIDVAMRHLAKPPSRVLVLGAGHAGMAAARAAMDAGARVTLLTRSERSRAAAQDALGAGAESALASAANIERGALEADVVVGAVFVPATATPKLLPRAVVARMKRGAVIVDISIDAGGVAETSHPTTHAAPTFIEEGVIHYCVGNMPAALPREAAEALSAAVLPFARELAGKGIARAVRENAALRSGVLLWKGRLKHAGIAAEAGVAYTSLSDSDLA